MMKIRITRGTDTNARRKIDEVLALYNADKGLSEGFTNDYPEKAHIITLKGAKGGLIVETIFKGGAFIYYAAFEESQRYKGNLQKCIDAYEKHTKNKIIGVQVNPFDNIEFWNKRGFTEQVFFNGALTYIDITGDELRRLMEERPNNEEF